MICSGEWMPRAQAVNPTNWGGIARSEHSQVMSADYNDDMDCWDWDAFMQNSSISDAPPKRRGETPRRRPRSCSSEDWATGNVVKAGFFTMSNCIWQALCRGIEKKEDSSILRLHWGAPCPADFVQQAMSILVQVGEVLDYDRGADKPWTRLTQGEKVLKEVVSYSNVHLSHRHQFAESSTNLNHKRWR